MNELSNITPYDKTNESKKRQVTNMFDGIAPYYDYLNRFLSLGVDIWWRKKAIGMLKKYPHQKILDVATGTADLAIEAVKTLTPKSIIGLDISANMLALGDKKIIKKQLSNVISLEVGDSENLRFNSGEFDVVMSAFGVRNFETLEKGLQEMQRVLKDDGIIMVLEFSKPKIFPLKQLFGIYFKFVLPVIGRIKSKDPKAYKYLYESVQAFPDYDNFLQILQTVGFKKTYYKALTGGICTIYIGEK